MSSRVLNQPPHHDEPPVFDEPSAAATLEARLADDEARLTADEARLRTDEEEARATRALSVTGVLVGVVLFIATAALVVAIIALRRDVHAIQTAAPPGSVATDSLRDGAVTADKLAAGSVTRAAIAAGAIGPAQLATGSVGSRAVAANALTAADIHESTLSPVPSAAAATTARRLGNAGASAYLAHLRIVHVSTTLSATPTKGPVQARCPDGTTVVSGGAAVDGALRGVAIARSTSWAHGWTATAHRSGGHQSSWRLVVTAICASGGA